MGMCYSEVSEEGLETLIFKGVKKEPKAFVVIPTASMATADRLSSTKRIYRIVYLELTEEGEKHIGCHFVDKSGSIYFTKCFFREDLYQYSYDPVTMQLTITGSDSIYTIPGKFHSAIYKLIYFY